MAPLDPNREAAPMTNANPKKVLVVGGSGTVGRGVVEGLAARGIAVRAATRDPSGWSGPSGAEPAALELRDPSTFGPALEGVDAVFQLSPAGEADQLGLLAPFVEAAAPRVRKIVTMTAQGVDASEDIPLRQLELAVERSGAQWAHLRPTWFAQNFNTYWHPPIAARGIIPVPAGTARTAFIDARDISNSAVAVLTTDDHDRRVWELTGPEALTYAEAAAILTEVTGREIRYVDVDEERFASDLRGAGLSADYAQLLVMLFAGVRAGVAAKTTGAVQTLTGARPRTLRQYATDHRASFSRGKETAEGRTP